MTTLKCSVIHSDASSVILPTKLVQIILRLTSDMGRRELSREEDRNAILSREATCGVFVKGGRGGGDRLFRGVLMEKACSQSNKALGRIKLSRGGRDGPVPAGV